jgi:hypothetical protein
MGFQDVLYPLCAVLNYGAAASRIPALRRHADRPSLALTAGFVALGTTFALATPAIWVQVDKITGLPNSAALIYQCLVIFYTACIQSRLLYWLDPETAGRRMRWRLVLAGFTIAAMTVLFLLADVGEQRVRDFVVHYAGMPIMGLYVLIYLTTFVIGRIDVTRLSLRYGPQAGGWLRRGLYLVAAGGVAGIIYWMARMADVIAPMVGINPLHWEVPAALAAVACSILNMIGLTMPSWGPLLSGVASWHVQRRQYRALHPLWASLIAEFPDRCLGIVPDRRVFLCRPHSLRLWLGRMKTEIRDVQMALGHASHADDLAALARTRAEAAGHTGDDLEAVVQATVIEYGLAEKTRTGELSGPANAAQLHGGTDTPTEIRFLLKVQRARRAPIVADILAQFHAGHPAPIHLCSPTTPPSGQPRTRHTASGASRLPFTGRTLPTAARYGLSPGTPTCVPG